MRIKSMVINQRKTEVLASQDSASKALKKQSVRPQTTTRPDVLPAINDMFSSQIPNEYFKNRLTTLRPSAEKMYLSQRIPIIENFRQTILPKSGSSSTPFFFAFCLAATSYFPNNSKMSFLN
jgi:hypothetical protein